MARVFQYVRPVNAVLTCVNLERRVNPTEIGIRIKEEPVDNNPNDETVEKTWDTQRRRSSRKRRRDSDSQEEDAEPSSEQAQKIADPSNELAHKIPEYGYTCNICFTSFFSEKGLAIHKTKYKNIIRCEICDKTFSTIRQMERHTLTHRLKVKQDHRLRHVCYLCKRKFSLRTHLQMHLFHCHGDLFYNSQKNDTKEVIADFDKFEAALRAAAATKADANAKHIDHNGKNTFLENIREFDKFVENIRLEDVIRSNDKLIDDIRLDQKGAEDLARPNAEISANTLQEERIKTEKVDESEEGSAGSDRTPGCPSALSYNFRKPKQELGSTLSPKSRLAKLLLEERLKIKYKCKQCSVRLVRCDNTSKRVLLKIDTSKNVTPVQLTIENPNRNSFNGKERLNGPKIRIVTLDNCIVVEVLEPR